MVVVDTNIIVRFLTRDDPAQYKKSHAIFAKRDVFIPDTVILETEWVLRYAYGYEPNAVCDALTKLFGLQNVRLSNSTLIAQVINWHRGGLDFADALHLAHSQTFTQMLTFDTRFVKKAKGLSDCVVTAP